jgi:hypothetical protein
LTIAANAPRPRPRGRRLWLGTIALAAAAGTCSTVDLGDAPADINACRPSEAFFVDQVWPNYLSLSFNGKTCGDASCHGAGTGNGLKVVAPTSTPTPTIPFASGSDWDVLYQSATHEMNCNDVLGSKLFALPAGQVGHGGGKLFDPADPVGTMVFDLLSQWVQAP